MAKLCVRIWVSMVMKSCEFQSKAEACRARAGEVEAQARAMSLNEHRDAFLAQARALRQQADEIEAFAPAG